MVPTSVSSLEHTNNPHSCTQKTKMPYHVKINWKENVGIFIKSLELRFLGYTFSKIVSLKHINRYWNFLSHLVSYVGVLRRYVT